MLDLQEGCWEVVGMLEGSSPIFSSENGVSLLAFLSWEVVAKREPPEAPSKFEEFGRFMRRACSFQIPAE